MTISILPQAAAEFEVRGAAADPASLADSVGSVGSVGSTGSVGSIDSAGSTGSAGSIDSANGARNSEGIHIGDGLSPAASSAEQARELHAVHSSAPLLSICIPTYSRAPHLAKCLAAIFSQIGDSGLVEVIVSDNASPDSTWRVANHYAARYSNMRLVRNAENIGADRNIFQVMRLGRGKFIKLQGDDDFFVPGTLLPLLHVLQTHPHCSLIHIYIRNNDGSVRTGQGMAEYLQAATIYTNFMTSIIWRKQDLDLVEQPDRFIASSFNQVYLQYAVLAHNPHFCIMNCSMFTYGSNASSDYNFGEVIFRSYQSILQHFIGKGLAMEDVRREKQRTLYEYAIPWFRYFMANGVAVDTSGFEEIYTEHYRDEPYYEDAWNTIVEIRQAYGGRDAGISSYNEADQKKR